MTSWMKWLLRGLAVALGLPLLLIAVEVGGYHLMGHPPITRFVFHELPFKGERFTPETWRDRWNCASRAECIERETKCSRGRMVDDLIDTYLQPGQLSQAQVGQLLGTPNQTFQHEAQQCVGYFVGMCSGFGLDHDSLYVCFDAAGQVADAGHRQH